MIIPNIWKKNVPNHQPDEVLPVGFPFQVIIPATSGRSFPRSPPGYELGSLARAPAPRIRHVGHAWPCPPNGSGLQHAKVGYQANTRSTSVLFSWYILTHPCHLLQLHNKVGQSTMSPEHPKQNLMSAQLTERTLLPHHLRKMGQNRPCCFFLL